MRQTERREWWLSNSREVYAAGTMARTLTRRYHGLLIAPINTPLGRYLVFEGGSHPVREELRVTAFH